MVKGSFTKRIRYENKKTIAADTQKVSSDVKKSNVFWMCLGVMLVLLMPVLCQAETFVLSSKDRVEDVALWNREFSKWNFGNSLLLEVGSAVGLYEFHSSVSLIRFDLSGLDFEQLKAAKLRLYKPNSFIQYYPVEVELYEVSPGNANWKEGKVEAARDSEGACWDFISNDKPWVGSSGLSVENIDFLATSLDKQIAPCHKGAWLEFTIPPQIIQNWLEHPEKNAGLLVKTHENAKWAEHAQFYSSEHHTGKGPQLVIEAQSGSIHPADKSKQYNQRQIFPKQDDPQFLIWLDKAKNRYTKWVREFKMTPAQALHIYNYDVIVRGDFLMPRVRVPMFQVMHETEQLIKAQDEIGARQKLKEIRELLLIWEYIRQTQWYDSGPLAEVLDPLQLAELYSKPDLGIFDRIDTEGKSFRMYDAAELDKIVKSKLKDIRDAMGFLEVTYQSIVPEYKEYVLKEHHYRNEIRKDMNRLYELIEQKQNNTETLKWVNKLHMDHELFLYYQSLFNTPRWSLLMEKADAIPLAKTYIDIRDSQHTIQRTKQQIDHAAKYYSKAQSFCSVDNATIVIGASAALIEQTAAKELQHFLGRMYPRTEFHIESKIPRYGGVILMGTLDSLPVLSVYVKPASLEHDESFVIRSVSNSRNPHLIVAGRDGRGVLMGGYKLLEKLGCEFYMSFETVPEKDKFLFEPMDWTDYPLLKRRFVFNWHNFLSGCTSWDFEQWQNWIIQSQKMGYNGIMVHAYGNNPMIGYEYNGKYRPVGYLTSTQVGRDWGTNHVNDVRRMWGGEVFDKPVFGSVASVEGTDRERAGAIQKLMQKVFDCAAKRDMDIYFAIDIDTESANPQELITVLPQSARFEVEKHWLAIPDTPEGYKYFKAQTEQLLKAYPDIDVLALWCRPGRRNGPWTRLTKENLPDIWQADFQKKLQENPNLVNHEWSPRLFGLAKVVEAYQRALKELGRNDVTVTFGTWLRRDVPPRRPGHCISLPLMDVFMPQGLPFMPLDWDVIRDDSFFEIPDKQADFTATTLVSHRPVWPIAWAHHDDGQYFGPPYKPFSEFYDRLSAMGTTEGFGVIHWMTKPLDLYFKSLANQVWVQTKNQPVDQTIRCAAEKMAGSDAAETFADYLNDWIATMPRVSRETSTRFMHTAREDDTLEGLEHVEEGYKRRMRKLDAMEESSLTTQGRTWKAYFMGLEQFILDLYRSEHRFRQAIESRNADDLDAAKEMLTGATPERIIAQFAEFSKHGGFTHGEKGLLVSMNTRWLSHYEMLRQMLGLAPVRYSFGPTSHEPLAQSPGLYTFYFDSQHRLWEVRGETETGYETYTFKRDANSPNSDQAEIVQTGLVSEKKIQLTVDPIMSDEKYAGSRSLAAGTYRLTLLTPIPTGRDISKTLSVAFVKDGVSGSAQTAQAIVDSGCNRFEYEITLEKPGVITLEIIPEEKSKLHLGGLTLSLLNN